MRSDLIRLSGQALVLAFLTAILAVFVAHIAVLAPLEGTAERIGLLLLGLIAAALFALLIYEAHRGDVGALLQRFNTQLGRFFFWLMVLVALFEFLSIQSVETIWGREVYPRLSDVFGREFWFEDKKGFRALLLHGGSALLALVLTILTRGVKLIWFALILVLVQFLIVVFRFVFEINAISAQQIVRWFHVGIFLVGAALTLREDGHVRVDIFYQNLTARGKARVNAIGGMLFLMPFCLLILADATFGATSAALYQDWRTVKGAVEETGFKAIYILRSLPVVFAVMLLIEGAALVCNDMETATRRVEKEPS